MRSARRARDERPLVLSLHGIRTTGKWQDDLADALDRAGFRHRALNFGFFRAMSLLLPWARQGKVDWFLQEVDRKSKDSTNAPSIIAHSFGSYIVTRALEKESLLKFDRIVLCGSIVRKDFPWTTILKGEQAKYVLNEAGGKDFWCGLVGWVVSDAGASGVEGFDDEANGRVMQLRHKLHRHSDYFTERNYIHRWIPFLQGIDPQVPPVRPRRRINWRFSSLMVLFASAAIAAAVWFWRTNVVSLEHEAMISQETPLPPDFSNVHSLMTGPATIHTPPTIQLQAETHTTSSRDTGQQSQKSTSRSATSTQKKEVARKPRTQEAPRDQSSEQKPESTVAKVDPSDTSSTTNSLLDPPGPTRTEATNNSLSPAQNAAECHRTCNAENYYCKKEDEYDDLANKYIDRFGDARSSASADRAWDQKERYDVKAQEAGAKCNAACQTLCG